MLSKTNEGNGRIISWPLLFQAVSNFGVPTVIVFIGGWWLSTYVASPLVSSHIRYLDSQIEISKDLSVTLKEANKIAKQNGEKITMTVEMMTKATEVMRDVPSLRKEQTELLKEIRDALKTK